MYSRYTREKDITEINIVHEHCRIAHVIDYQERSSYVYYAHSPEDKPTQIQVHYCIGSDEKTEVYPSQAVFLQDCLRAGWLLLIVDGQLYTDRGELQASIRSHSQIQELHLTQCLSGPDVSNIYKICAEASSAVVTTVALLVRPMDQPNHSLTIETNPEGVEADLFNVQTINIQRSDACLRDCDLMVTEYKHWPTLLLTVVEQTIKQQQPGFLQRLFRSPSNTDRQTILERVVYYCAHDDFTEGNTLIQLQRSDSTDQILRQVVIDSRSQAYTLSTRHGIVRVTSADIGQPQSLECRLDSSPLIDVSLLCKQYRWERSVVWEDIIRSERSIIPTQNQQHRIRFSDLGCIMQNGDMVQLKWSEESKPTELTTDSDGLDLFWAQLFLSQIDDEPAFRDEDHWRFFQTSLSRVTRLNIALHDRVLNTPPSLASVNVQDAI